MSQQPVLYLYTISFPLNGETFLANELTVLARRFHRVVIFPSSPAGERVRVPGNVTIVFREPTAQRFRLTSLLKNILLITEILQFEYRSSGYRFFFLRRFRLTVSEILNALLYARQIQGLLEKEKSPVINYSFWMNESALALSILKKRGRIKNFVFRTHGFDLYEERWPNNYIPFRATCYKYASRIYAVSKMGASYINRRFSLPGKVEVSYLGTNDNGVNPMPTNDFVIVTCSSIIPLKRLALLARALRHLTFELKWIHLGDGSVADKAELLALISQLPVNIKVELKGFLSQEQVFEFYRAVPASVFINVSVTEGLPVSIMEAISFGIPIIATNVGGTSEIVTETSGVLLEADADDRRLAEVISAFRVSEMNTDGFRGKVRIFWRENFLASTNYQCFGDALFRLRD